MERLTSLSCKTYLLNHIRTIESSLDYYCIQRLVDNNYLNNTRPLVQIYLVGANWDYNSRNKHESTDYKL